MPQQSREFEPLMISIENVLKALEGRADASTVNAAASELRYLYDQYAECCCRRAHVVKDAETQA